jgi:uncharacterized protein YdiU (UPF0061 family)
MTEAGTAIAPDGETLEPREAAHGSVSPRFDNSYARLPDRFFTRVRPAISPAPKLVKLNQALAATLGLDPRWLSSKDGLDMVSGSAIASGSEPIAQAYAGHQFGNFVPQLGDGRAVLLGEIVDVLGKRRDIQLKGSGRTPFSRGGDGKAALGPVLRICHQRSDGGAWHCDDARSRRGSDR